MIKELFKQHNFLHQYISISMYSKNDVEKLSNPTSGNVHMVL